MTDKSSEFFAVARRQTTVLGALLTLTIIVAGCIFPGCFELAMGAAVAVSLLLLCRVQSLADIESVTVSLKRAQSHAEALAREHAALIKTINHQLIVSIAGLDGRIVEANDRLVSISGYSREELLGQNHRILASGLHPRAFWQDMWRTVASGGTWRAEVCNRRKDGSLYWVDSLVAPIVGEDGRAERYLSIRADITWRKEAEAALAKQAEHSLELAANAEAASRAKSSFLANMSHEIRTPMNGVLGMTELLLGMELAPAQKDAARTIYQSAEALLVILDDVLDFSKIEAGRLTFERIVFDPEELLHDAVNLFRGRVKGRPLELLVRVRPGTPARVWGDPTRVRQILTNLIGNALKFTTRGHVLVEMEGSGGVVTMRVTDTGPGVPPNRQTALFEPFVQADASTSRRYGGTGLGLAISRRLAEGMGGTLQLTSPPEGGACFELVLPLERAPAPGQAQPLVGQRVLVVEPHELRRNLLVEQLLALGAIGRGVDKLDGVELGEFDVVLAGPRDLERLSGAFPGPVVLCTPEPGRNDTAPVASMLLTPCSAGCLAQCIESARAGTPPNEVSQRPAPPVHPRRRVLLAEDNAINQRIARSMLEGLNCEVTIVDNGRAAVEAAALTPWDIIFMDWQMPELDGLEAAAQIRANERRVGRAPTPIVALTANVTADDRARCVGAGMDSHVGKPVRSLELEAVLTTLSPRRAA